MVLAVKSMALIDLILEFGFLCRSIMNLNSFTGGNDGWNWQQRYGADWEDALLANNNPFHDDMWSVLFCTLALRLLMAIAVVAAFAIDSCMGLSVATKRCDGKGAQIMHDVYAVLLICLFVLTGLCVFWFYIA